MSSRRTSSLKELLSLLTSITSSAGKAVRPASHPAYRTSSRRGLRTLDPKHRRYSKREQGRNRMVQTGEAKSVWMHSSDWTEDSVSVRRHPSSAPGSSPSPAALPEDASDGMCSGVSGEEADALLETMPPFLLHLLVLLRERREQLASALARMSRKPRGHSAPSDSSASDLAGYASLAGILGSCTSNGWSPPQWTTGLSSSSYSSFWPTSNSTVRSGEWEHSSGREQCDEGVGSGTQDDSDSVVTGDPVTTTETTGTERSVTETVSETATTEGTLVEVVSGTENEITSAAEVEQYDREKVTPMCYHVHVGRCHHHGAPQPVTSSSRSRAFENSSTGVVSPYAGHYDGAETMEGSKSNIASQQKAPPDSSLHAPHILDPQSLFHVRRPGYPSPCPHMAHLPFYHYARPEQQTLKSAVDHSDSAQSTEDLNSHFLPPHQAPPHPSLRAPGPLDHQSFPYRNRAGYPRPCHHKPHLPLYPHTTSEQHTQTSPQSTPSSSQTPEQWATYPPSILLQDFLGETCLAKVLATKSKRQVSQLCDPGGNVENYLTERQVPHCHVHAATTNEEKVMNRNSAVLGQVRWAGNMDGNFKVEDHAGWENDEHESNGKLDRDRWEEDGSNEGQGQVGWGNENEMKWAAWKEYIHRYYSSLSTLYSESEEALEVAKLREQAGATTAVAVEVERSGRSEESMLAAQGKNDRSGSSVQSSVHTQQSTSRDKYYLSVTEGTTVQHSVGSVPVTHNVQEKIISTASSTLQNNEPMRNGSAKDRRNAAAKVTSPAMQSNVRSQVPGAKAMLPNVNRNQGSTCSRTLQKLQSGVVPFETGLNVTLSKDRSQDRSSNASVSKKNPKTHSKTGKTRKAPQKIQTDNKSLKRGSRANPAVLQDSIAPTGNTNAKVFTKGREAKSRLSKVHAKERNQSGGVKAALPKKQPKLRTQLGLGMPLKCRQNVKSVCDTDFWSKPPEVVLSRRQVKTALRKIGELTLKNFVSKGVSMSADNAELGRLLKMLAATPTQARAETVNIVDRSEAPPTNSPKEAGDVSARGESASCTALVRWSEEPPAQSDLEDLGAEESLSAKGHVVAATSRGMVDDAGSARRGRPRIQANRCSLQTSRSPTAELAPKTTRRRNQPDFRAHAKSREEADLELRRNREESRKRELQRSREQVRKWRQKQEERNPKGQNAGRSPSRSESTPTRSRNPPVTSSPTTRKPGSNNDTPSVGNSRRRSSVSRESRASGSGTRTSEGRSVSLSGSPARKGSSERKPSDRKNLSITWVA